MDIKKIVGNFCPFEGDKEYQILEEVLEECQEISCFLQRFVVVCDDDEEEVFEDLKISLQVIIHKK